MMYTFQFNVLFSRSRMTLFSEFLVHKHIYSQKFCHRNFNYYIIFIRFSIEKIRKAVKILKKRPHRKSDMGSTIIYSYYSKYSAEC